ncbi:4-hydroxy-tetrahydrodipicolinate reductase [Deferribacterales bacterium Es71-Z0220]|uniref:4-hydroxy-tetrahydrodipicolinate reductase n=1 Tax=Deferrivibrio essentukiensis TaxID=2880922 RepID=UPI001F6132B1|nr:4-hydroxy-tetrahydrodipicolinate reductase [Deferrivibrio essentukiensis]MCB4203882.1 4-hydroxy-tetrahydrodipicolinate reductase [Deferrivibrio essentukiensis]
MVNIGVIGAAGRMGRRIIALSGEDANTNITAAYEYSKSEFLGQDSGTLAGIGETGIKIESDIENAKNKCDVLIDFTGAKPTMSNLEKYRVANIPLVIGSTGFEPDEIERIKELGKQLPVVFAPNMSLGVNLTFKILEMVSKAIGDIYDIEIIESHHRLKKDAPSGTAMKMAEVIANTLKRDLDKDAVYCRRGLIGERTDKEIGIQTIRAGDIVGEHTVMFCGQGERIEITHKAHTRDTFAKGAITAAKWLKGKSPALYSMFDVLGL